MLTKALTLKWVTINEWDEETKKRRNVWRIHLHKSYYFGVHNIYCYIEETTKMFMKFLCCCCGKFSKDKEKGMPDNTLQNIVKITSKKWLFFFNMNVNVCLNEIMLQYTNTEWIKSNHMNMRTMVVKWGYGEKGEEKTKRIKQQKLQTLYQDIFWEVIRDKEANLITKEKRFVVIAIHTEWERHTRTENTRKNEIKN